MIQRISKSPAVMMLLCALMVSAQAQNPTTSSSNPSTTAETQAPNPTVPPPATVQANAQAAIQTPPALKMPHTWEPFGAYRSSTVPEPTLTNSPRFDQLIRDGKLYISLKDAIALAIENNLDVAIARYNLPIADTDVLRTKAGASFRGVNTGVVQGTPGGGVGGFGAGAPGAGAGGTTGGAGGAGAGAAGLVQSTLGTGAAVQSYDPVIFGNMGIEHLTQPLANLQLYGVPELQQNTGIFNLTYQQSFGTGTTVSFETQNNRQTTNSIYSNLSPSLGAYYRVTVQQQLLAGFGLGPNLRFLRIARNNKKISDIAFKDQLVATVTQIADMYWDLVSAYEAERVTEQSYSFAQQSLSNAQKQLQLEAVPAMDVMRAEAEVTRRDQDLLIAKTTLQLQESLMKNAITKNLDDPTLESMPVIPTDRSEMIGVQAEQSVTELIDQALRDRPELAESDIDLVNRQISRQAAKNNLLPALSLVGYYGGTGLAGELNPAYYTHNESTLPTNYWGAFENSFNGSSPDYFVGLNLNIPIRNRVAKADQYRSELEYRQAELRLQQLKKQIRIEVRNAQYALEQSHARVQAAQKARDLAQKTFTIMQKEQDLGAGSPFQTLTAQRDLALSELDLVNANTAYQKSKVELQRATGTTLADNGIEVQKAVDGIAPGGNQVGQSTSTN
jgi:outer membrane protein TolC